MSVTIETDLKNILEKIYDKLYFVSNDIAAKQKEINAKFDGIQKKLTDLKVDLAITKTKVEV